MYVLSQMICITFIYGTLSNNKCTYIYESISTFNLYVHILTCTCIYVYITTYIYKYIWCVEIHNGI